MILDNNCAYVCEITFQTVDNKQYREPHDIIKVMSKCLNKSDTSLEKITELTEELTIYENLLLQTFGFLDLDIEHP